MATFIQLPTVMTRDAAEPAAQRFGPALDDR